ncbi:MAPEG family protein [Myxococcota bacterium]|nr:MAPEG family protein [Myxococcota bacterium]
MIARLAAFAAPRARVLKWIAMGYTSFVVVFLATWNLAPRLAPIEAPLDRLLLAVQLQALPAAVVMLVLQGLWRAGDTVEAETRVLDGMESRGWKINQRVMDNTLEQAAIFSPMLAALALRIDPEHTFVLPFLVGIWTAGRVLFWIGYRIEPVYRAIGMDWTSSVAMITAGWLASTLL